MNASRRDPTLKFALVRILVNNSKAGLIKLLSMIYTLSKEIPGVEKSLEESIPENPVDVAPGKEEELPGKIFISHDKLLERIKRVYVEDNVVQRIIQAKRAGEKRVPIDIIRTESLKLELGRCEIKNDLLYITGRLYIPADNDLRTGLIRAIYELRVRGYTGRTTTYKRLSL